MSENELLVKAQCAITKQLNGLTKCTVYCKKLLLTTSMCYSCYHCYKLTYERLGNVGLYRCINIILGRS
jgi:hypothetical protein